MSALVINGINVDVVAGGFKVRYNPQESLAYSRSGKLRRSRRANPRIFSVTTAQMDLTSSATLESTLAGLGPYACSGPVLRGVSVNCYPKNVERNDGQVNWVSFTFELWEAL